MHCRLLDADDNKLKNHNSGLFVLNPTLKRHNRSFGKTIRSLRLSQHLSQETLGFEAGLDRTYISLLERGLRSPTLDSMVSLARALNVSLTEIAAAIEANDHNAP
ncbi:helix-turn-helix domain-containing protein [Burkholderia sp. LMG 13014]|uniref:helix-turn-helix domain-containing protein n=1 Tax=Burkholderia sp. LMG 13014 TaxID=2709306 RepID=UPI001F05D18D|nr:helix-turn-helix transcriptional regulator [Burkholderia sp. LMG 13014]